MILLLIVLEIAVLFTGALIIRGPMHVLSRRTALHIGKIMCLLAVSITLPSLFSLPFNKVITLRMLLPSIAIALFLGIPSALPICVIMHWRNWQKYGAWALAGFVSSLLPLMIYQIESLLSFQFEHHSALPVSWVGDFLKISFLMCAYSIPAALLYGYLWRKRKTTPLQEILT